MRKSVLRGVPFRLVLASISFVCCGLYADYAPVESGAGIPDIWKPGQHLYVKGRLGIQEAHLNALETYLGQQAPNWTVVLLEHARNEAFTDPSGVSHQGMDAVEYALGSTLSANDAFRELKDERSGEENGAVFILYLQERKLSYFGSAVYDKRNLGESRWIGDLDRSAIQAMRSGGRVIDAAKKTIQHIDGQLDRRFAAEKTSLERQARETRERHQSAIRAAQEAQTLLGKIIAERDAFRARLGQPAGDLAHPRLSDLEATIQQANQQFRQAYDAPLRKRLDAATARLLQIRQSFRDHKRAGAELDALAAELAEAGSPGVEETGPEYLPQIEEAMAACQRARFAHADADSAYRTARNQASLLLEQAQHHQSAYMAEQARLVRQAQVREQTRLAEVARLQREAELQQALKMYALLAACVLIIGLGLILHLRRRPDKREAEALLGTWQNGIQEKTDGLLTLLDRTMTVIGDSASLEERGYRGETLALSRDTIKDVDELFIMSSCVDRVLKEAGGYIFPTGFFGAVRNFFFSGAYRKAQRILKDQPIAFAPEKGLDLMIPGQERLQHNDLLGRREDYAPFELSFEELIDAFNQRAADALDQLQTLEVSWDSIAERLDELKQDLAALGISIDAQQAASSSDGWLAGDAIEDLLLPAAAEALEEAQKDGFHDPVHVIKEPARIAGERLSDARTLTEHTQAFRNESLPDIIHQVDALDQGGRKTRWVDETLQLLSDQLDQSAQQAAHARLDADGPAFAAALESFAGRVSRALELSGHRDRESRMQIDTRREAIGQTRIALASNASFEPDQLLKETDHNPDTWLESAEELYRSAAVSLDLGHTDATARSLDEIRDIGLDVDALLARAELVRREQKARVEALREHVDKVEGAFPEHDGILVRIKRDFTIEALRIQAGDAGYPDRDETVEQHDQLLRDHVMLARTDMDHAEKVYLQGGLFESDARLSRALDRLSDSDLKLEQIREQDARLQQTVQGNDAELIRLQAALKQMTDERSDVRTMQATLELAERADAEMKEAAELVKAERRDPFRSAEALKDLDTLIQALAARVRTDWRLHEDAGVALRDAKEQHGHLEKLARRSQKDRIPDSPEIVHAVSALNRLSPEVEVLSARYAEPHTDWLALHQSLDAFTMEAARLSADLKRELEAAQQCLKVYEAASSAVRQARNWSGSYGVSLYGDGGNQLLHQAYSALGQGHYANVEALSEQARRSAFSAINDADAEVARRRREAEEEAAAARRAAQRRQRMMSQSSSIGSSSRSSFSSSRSSSRSGFSRSGSSSGSGFSRSGW